MLADEPTGNLDSVNGQHVLELLGVRQRESGTTLVLVTHDVQIADRADRRIQLRDGLVDVYKRQKKCRSFGSLRSLRMTV